MNSRLLWIIVLLSISNYTFSQSKESEYIISSACGNHNMDNKNIYEQIMINKDDYFSNNLGGCSIYNDIQNEVSPTLHFVKKNPLLNKKYSFAELKYNYINTEKNISKKNIRYGARDRYPCFARRRYPWFAIKTNLLYDLAITPNLEVEIPIGKKWSINAEYQYGWWLKKDDSFCWQIEAGGLELRRWIRNRNVYNRKVLTGWFVGWFVSSGIYDFQLKSDQGYQGELVLATGLSGGYSKPIGKDFRLEFSLGLGYMITDYTKYVVISEDLYKLKEKTRLSTIMISKAKISFVWLLKRHKRRGY